MQRATFIAAALIAAASAVSVKEQEQPVVAEFDMMHQDWSDLCDPEEIAKFDEYFQQMDLDGNTFLTIDEVEAAVAAFIEDPVERAFIESHLPEAFKLADMKKFHEDNVKDERVSPAEAMNFFHQCAAGQPKVFYAYLHMSEAAQFPQAEEDQSRVPDCHVADVMGELGLDRNESLLTLLHAEKRERFPEHDLPFWFVWEAMMKAAGKWEQPAPAELTESYDILDDDWSWFCTEEGKSFVEPMFEEADKDGSGLVSMDELMDVFRGEFEGDALDFFLRQDYIVNYTAYSDKEISPSEWFGFWYCHHGEPKSWYAYSWLSEAEKSGGEGHNTLTDEHVAEWLGGMENFPMNHDEVLAKLATMTRSNWRNDEGELYFLIVFKKLIRT